MGKYRQNTTLSELKLNLCEFSRAHDGRGRVRSGNIDSLQFITSMATRGHTAAHTGTGGVRKGRKK